MNVVFLEIKTYQPVGLELEVEFSVRFCNLSAGLCGHGYLH